MNIKKRALIGYPRCHESKRAKQKEGKKNPKRDETRRCETKGRKWNGISFSFDKSCLRDEKQKEPATMKRKKLDPAGHAKENVVLPA